MEQPGRSLWISVVDREDGRLRATRVLPRPDHWFLRIDERSSNDECRVWRAAPLRQESISADDPVVMVDVVLDQRGWVPAAIPDVVHPELFDPPQLRTLWATPGSFTWSVVLHDDEDPHDELERRVQDFDRSIAWFPGFSRRVFELGDLWDNTKWDWGFEAGVYCFTSGDGEDVHYVGRAMTATVGARIWAQMNSQDHEEWRQVVTDRGTKVVVYFVDSEHVYMATALEAFLIDKLKPKFNLRCQ